MNIKPFELGLDLRDLVSFLFDLLEGLIGFHQMKL
jgi:hypothetical protein